MTDLDLIKQADDKPYGWFIKKMQTLSGNRTWGLCEEEAKDLGYNKKETPFKVQCDVDVINVTCAEEIIFAENKEEAEELFKDNFFISNCNIAYELKLKITEE